jgi:DNA/RNA-binding domain of Phe-tRNA-synthetase-like protein
MVTTRTSNALVVVFAPRDIDVAHLHQVLDTTADRLTDLAGGHEINRAVCA